MRGGLGNMKTNIQIKQSENKQTSAGKPYWRFLTSEGWISVFQKPIAEKLNENINGILEVELTETESNGYINKNITKIYGVVEGNPIVSEIKMAQGIVQKDARDAFAEQRERKEQSIYTSYAKDLFLAMMTNIDKLERLNNGIIKNKDIMQECIELV